VPPSRPDEFGDRFPRPFRVHNDSRWSEAFASAPAPVLDDARTVYNGCAWLQAIHNRLLDAEVSRLRGELSVRELLNEVIYTRAALHQLYLIFSTHYRVLAEQSSNPTLSPNVQDLLLAPADSDSVYSPTTSIFESSVLAHRAYSISREQALHVQSRLHPQRGCLSAPPPPPGGLTPSARRCHARQLRLQQLTAGGAAHPPVRGPNGAGRGGGGGGGTHGGGGGGGSGGGRQRDGSSDVVHPRGSGGGGGGDGRGGGGGGGHRGSGGGRSASAPAASS